MNDKVPVSILIPIYNEQDNLPRCLDSVDWADEVIVVDSHSTDRSERIAVDQGARIVQFDFNGIWPKKKNWALENIPFRHNWVFILDADEELAPGAREELSAIIAARDSDIVGYWINRRFHFMGKWLRHAYYPNWNLRFFQHQLGRYEQLTSTATYSGDNEVHEHVIIRGKTGRLKTEMNHYAFPSVEIFVEKHNRYSNWEARVALERSLPESGAKLQHVRVGFRRRLKAFSQRLPFRPSLRFLYVYFWQMGFLDGREGYYFARLHGLYELLCITKTYELKKKNTS